MNLLEKLLPHTQQKTKTEIKNLKCAILMQAIQKKIIIINVLPTTE